MFCSTKSQKIRLANFLRAKIDYVEQLPLPRLSFSKFARRGNKFWVKRVIQHVLFTVTVYRVIIL